jgi:fatty-acyl-CoA synthase
MEDLAFQPLSPVSFLERSALVYGDRPAVVSEGRTFTYAEHWERVRRLAGMLHGFGLGDGERVAVLAPNTHVLLEASTGVAAGGAVLVALNVRLQPREIATILDHCEASMLIVDRHLLGAARAAVEQAGVSPHVVVAGADVDGHDEYNALLAASYPRLVPVADERSLLSLNYTSGTTGTPKGVMYHHRGAYLQALAMAFHARLDLESRYLWTLPMFHTNGWCFPWAVTAAGGVHVCLRSVVPDAVWRKLCDESVTHFCAAPTVLTSLAAAEQAAPLKRMVRAMTGGAPPSPSLLRRMDELNIEVLHLYGLTETFGPAVLCDWRPEWNGGSPEERASRLARQGVGNVIAQRVRVVDEHGADVPADGETLGQVAVRGNNVMLGYYRDEEATGAAAPDGWFRTGDLAVMHPDGYVELRDRLKDVIISGGENISSIEVENVLCQHPAVQEAAVVGVPHDHWGEVPVGFVAMRAGATAKEDELVAFVRERLAHFKAPRSVVVGELPKSSTGKIQKNVLRERARSSSGGPDHAGPGEGTAARLPWADATGR